MASENLCGLCKHYNHFAQLTTTTCRRKIAVIWHRTARKQESRAGGKVTARGAKWSLGGKNVIIPTKIGVKRSFLERLFNFCTQRQRYFHAVTHILLSQPLLIVLLFFGPKMDPTIFSRFSSPELLQSTITPGSIWNQSLLSILSLAEH